MSSLKFLMVAALLVIPSISMQASESKPPRVEVFTLSDRPVRGVDALERRGITVDVYVVDAVEQMNRTLSAGLPTNVRQATSMASHRIQQQSADLSRRYQQAARGLLRAQRLGVQRVPAVVFDDGQTIVLGVTDLEVGIVHRSASAIGRREVSMRRTLLIGLLIGQLLFSPADAGEITTDAILGHTAAALPSCLNWRPVGVCLWLKCSIYECEVESSIKIAHNLPDLVVPVYNDVNEHPWPEMGTVLNTLQQRALEGILGQLTGSTLIGSSGQPNETQVMGNRQHQAFFRETDVIGHPLLATTQLIEAIPGGWVCPSAVTPFLPYFQSTLDALVWRNFVPAELLYPASWTPGLREIGHWPHNTWGHVHPRIGFLEHQAEPKAAATLAQRAGDLVTRTQQPHLYLPTPQGVHTSAGLQVWSPPPLEEMKPETGTWQMLVPKPERGLCGLRRERHPHAIRLVGWQGG